MSSRQLYSSDRVLALFTVKNEHSEMTVGKPLTVKKATSGGYMGVFAPFD